MASIPEPADRNKSELTHRVTLAAHQWLENHGFKPVEEEVGMPWTDVNEKGWIADIAGVIVPTQTELIEMKFLPRPPRYPYGRNDDDYQVKYAAWKALYKPLDRRMTCLVEVKTSRADFMGDRKWKMTPPTDLAYVAMPPGIVKQDEWPEGWGILELRGDLVAQVRTPTPRQATDKEHFFVVYNLAVRCDHRTRHLQSRISAKEYRAEATERTSVDRIDKIIYAVRDIVSRKAKWSNEPLKSVETAFRQNGIRHFTDRHLEELSKLFKMPARDNINE